MNILVCVKQVPDTNEIKIDPVKNTLIRQGVPSIVNPFDGYALEAAARIKPKRILRPPKTAIASKTGIRISISALLKTANRRSP